MGEAEAVAFGVGVAVLGLVVDLGVNVYFPSCGVLHWVDILVAGLVGAAAWAEEDDWDGLSLGLAILALAAIVIYALWNLSGPYGC